jgi:hypothetical protein
MTTDTEPQPNTFTVDANSTTRTYTVDDLVSMESELATLRRRAEHGRDIASQIASQERIVDQATKNLKREKDALETLNMAAAKFLAGVDPNQQEIDLEAATVSEAKEPEYTANDDGAMEIPGLDWSKVELAALSGMASTGKPPRVRPVEMPDGSRLVLTDVQARVAIMVPALTAEQFDQRYPGMTRYEMPSEQIEATESAETVGFPVKVKRTKLWLAAIGDAWRVAIPLDAKIGGEASGGDEALFGDAEEGEGVES